MTDFIVTDWLSLGEAISESVSGDRILVESGNYAVMPIKNSVTCICPEDFSVKVGMTPFGMTEKFNCGVIEQNGLRIENISHDPDIIKGIYIYRKKLPFGVHVKSPTSFIHPNGAIIDVLGNDREGLSSLTSDVESGDDLLPKGVVDICIPFVEEINFQTNWVGASPTLEEILNQQTERNKVMEFERRFAAPGLQISDMEYKALWAFNSFIAIYGAHTNKETKLIGYSATEFMDELQTAKSNDIVNVQLAPAYCIEGHNSQMAINIEKISNDFLSTQIFSPDKYIIEMIHRLNYPQAVIAIFQAIENRFGAKNKKYKAIDSAANLSMHEKQYLTEILLCRNTLLHTKKFALNSNISNFEESKKKYPGLLPISEFGLYATKRPWYWFNAYLKLIV
jgi:hypothetical protein